MFDNHGRQLCKTLDEAIHLMLHRKSDDGKLRVLMIYEKAELMNEIASMAWVEADTAVEGDEATDSKMHNYTEVAEEDNWPMVSRWVALAVTEIEQMLLQLTKRNTHGHRSIDNKVPRRLEWLIEMRVKPEASDTTVTLLMNLAGEYIKQRVLQEWAGLSYPTVQPYWAQQAEITAEKIKEAGRSCDSVHNVRRPMWPAW